MDTKCVIKSALCIGQANGGPGLAMIYNDDGTFWSKNYSGSPAGIASEINSKTDLFSVSAGSTGVGENTVIVTILKDGYYAAFGSINSYNNPGFTPAVLTAGTTISCAWSYGGAGGYPQSFGILYCGTSVPS